MGNNKTGKNGKEPGKHNNKWIEPSPTALEYAGMTRQYCLHCDRVTPHKHGVCVWH